MFRSTGVAAQREPERAPLKLASVAPTNSLRDERDKTPSMGDIVLTRWAPGRIFEVAAAFNHAPTASRRTWFESLRSERRRRQVTSIAALTIRSPSAA